MRSGIAVPRDIEHQRQIAARYLEHLTMSLRARARAARARGETDATLSAETWAERAQELRAYITTKPRGGNDHEQHSSFE